LPDLAAELPRQKFDFVVTEGADTVRFVQQMSTMIPIVMAEATAPVELVVVQSLAQRR